MENHNIDWTKKTQDRLQKLLKIREQLHSDTFGIVELKTLKLTDSQAVIQKQRQRLGATDPRITLQQLGFSTVKNKDNLFHLIKQGKAKVINFQSDGYNLIKIRIETSENLDISIQNGTLFFPAADPKNLMQTLIVNDEIRAKLHSGINNLIVKTLCFNRQLSCPGKQQYLLGEIRYISHQPNMSQKKVWEITIERNKQIKLLQEKLKKQDYIALSEKNLMSLFNLWKTG